MLSGHTGHVNILRLVEKLGRTRLFSGAWDRTVIVWDVEARPAKLLRRVSVGMQARCLRVTRFRETLVVGAFEGKLSFWSLGSLASPVCTGTTHQATPPTRSTAVLKTPFGSRKTSRPSSAFGMGTAQCSCSSQSRLARLASSQGTRALCVLWWFSRSGG